MGEMQPHGARPPPAREDGVALGVAAVPVPVPVGWQFSDYAAAAARVRVGVSREGIETGGGGGRFLDWGGVAQDSTGQPVARAAAIRQAVLHPFQQGRDDTVKV